MDAANALTAIRRAWYLVLAGMIGAIAVAFALHAITDPVYETSSTYVISPAQDPTDPGAVQESIRTLDDARSRAIVATFTEVLDSTAIHEEAAQSIGIQGLSADDYDFSAVILPEANVVELTVRGPRPQAAALLSGAVGDLAAARFSELYLIYDIVLLDPPSIPTEPANTPLPQRLVMAAALGLLAGAALALLWGSPQLRKIQQRERRLLSYTVSEAPSVVTPLHKREDQQAAGSG
jgi:capsular polysaccharide biosynthesis protein